MPFLLLLCSVSPSDWVSKGWKKSNKRIAKSLKALNPWLFSARAEWKVHLNSIFFVNALLIRHSTIFIPLCFSTCGFPSNERHKNVIKFQLIFKYVPLRNCFPFRIIFLRANATRRGIFPWKAQARSGKSDAVAKCHWNLFFPSFDSFPISIIRVFHLLDDRKRVGSRK